MKKAQAKFIRDQFLNRFTGEYKLVDVKGFPIIQQILFQSGLDFNKDILKNLTKTGSISSGKLADVSVPIIIENPNQYILQIGYPENSEQIEYYDFINKGVGGVGGKNARLKKTDGKYKFKNLYVGRKMAANLFKWLNKARKSVRTETITRGQKGLNKVQKKNIKLATVVSESANKRKLAYNIGRSIKRNGIAATYYFDKAIASNFNESFKESLLIALGGDLNLQIKANGNNNNSSTTNG